MQQLDVVFSDLVPLDCKHKEIFCGENVTIQNPNYTIETSDAKVNMKILQRRIKGGE